MRLALQLAVLAVLTIVWSTAHVLAGVIVAHGWGLMAIAMLLLSAPILSRYLD